ncbi:hypothetical protein EMPG_10661 [Blastomyces silverae]|uniref:Uncharacterized protein n=1 Tax=Blastomyces silverae TaxID=2060906 RepID=A0A0H1B3A8_9EURO|nr:hypothetical protein EMPG_10661 [Blastomyces silverae]
MKQGVKETGVRACACACAYMPVMDGMQNTVGLAFMMNPMMNIYDGDLPPVKMEKRKQLQGVSNTDMLCVCSLGAIGQPDCRMDGRCGNFFFITHRTRRRIMALPAIFSLTRIPAQRLSTEKKPWRTKPTAEFYSTML